MDFFTVVLRQSSGYWVALCLENGIVGQAEIREDAISKLQEAIESFKEAYQSKPNIHHAPFPLKNCTNF
jgi:predicted RNase H-like HicB family nuclease